MLSHLCQAVLILLEIGKNLIIDPRHLNDWVTYIVEIFKHVLYFLCHLSIVISLLTSRLTSSSFRHLRGNQTFQGLSPCTCDSKFLRIINVHPTALVKTRIRYGSQSPVSASRWWRLLVRRRAHISFVLLYCLRHFASSRIRLNFTCWGVSIPSIALWSPIMVGCLWGIRIDNRAFLSLSLLFI